MNVDKASFFATLAALAAGGAGGYYAGDHHALRSVESSELTGAAEHQAAPAAESVTPPASPPAPVCDDAVGDAVPCPPPGYSADEGQPGCMLATKRCADFKDTMKPRVAETAVTCLDALSPAQRCDANRVAYCGHAALMAACDTGGPPAQTREPDEIGATCTAITTACQGASLTPSARDCRATLAGLTALGRQEMASCMKAHCSDKGLLGCETSLITPPLAQ
jgi:hypothetical protein